MKNQKGFIPVIIILVVLIGFVGVYYLGTLKQKNTTVNPTTTPVVSSLPSSVATSKPATPDPTVNWKKYTNTKYGYSISYPSSYVISNVADGSSSTVPSDADNISLRESVNSKYEDRLLDLSYQGYLIDISPADQWQKSSVVVAGVNSSKYTKIDGSVNFDYYHVPLKGTVGIELMVNNKQKVKVDQILSTFKFTN